MNPPHQNGRDAGGRRRSPVAVLTLVVVAVAIGLIAAAASASGALPRAPTFLNATASDGLQGEPATITYTGDGTGLLGGANVRTQGSGIDWTKWTTQIARGTGFNQLNNCNPSCAGGRFRGYRVRIELWRPRVLHRALVFTRMTIFYQHSPPRGEPRHYTFTDSYLAGAGGGYGWGPPTEQGYCVHTSGLKPAAGCNNIHSLP